MDVRLSDESQALRASLGSLGVTFQFRQLREDE